MSMAFDEIIQKARDVALAAGKVAGDVVGEVVDGSKAKLTEVKLSGEIREVTERLGAIVYEAAKTGRDSIKLQEMLIGELDNLYRTLGELHKRTAAAVVEIICPACGEKNAPSAFFCCKCGAKLSKDETASAPSSQPDYVVEEDIPPYTAEDAAAEVEAVAAEVEAVVAEVEEAVRKLTDEE